MKYQELELSNIEQKMYLLNQDVNKNNEMRYLYKCGSNYVIMIGYDEGSNPEKIVNSTKLDAFWKVADYLNEENNVIVWIQAKGTTSDWDVFIDYADKFSDSDNIKKFLNKLYNKVVYSDECVNYKYRVCEFGIFNKASLQPL